MSYELPGPLWASALAPDSTQNPPPQPATSPGGAGAPSAPTGITQNVFAHSKSP